MGPKGKGKAGEFVVASQTLSKLLDDHFLGVFFTDIDKLVTTEVVRPWRESGSDLLLGKFQANGYMSNLGTYIVSPKGYDEGTPYTQAMHDFLQAYLVHDGNHRVKALQKAKAAGSNLPHRITMGVYRPFSTEQARFIGACVNQSTTDVVTRTLHDNIYYYVELIRDVYNGKTPTTIAELARYHQKHHIIPPGGGNNKRLIDIANTISTEAFDVLGKISQDYDATAVSRLAWNPRGVTQTALLRLEFKKAEPLVQVGFILRLARSYANNKKFMGEEEYGRTFNLVQAVHAGSSRPLLQLAPYSEWPMMLKEEIFRYIGNYDRDMEAQRRLKIIEKEVDDYIATFPEGTSPKAEDLEMFRNQPAARFVLKLRDPLCANMQSKYQAFKSSLQTIKENAGRARCNMASDKVESMDVESATSGPLAPAAATAPVPTAQHRLLTASEPSASTSTPGTLAHTAAPTPAMTAAHPPGIPCPPPTARLDLNFTSPRPADAEVPMAMQCPAAAPASAFFAPPGAAPDNTTSGASVPMAFTIVTPAQFRAIVPADVEYSMAALAEEEAAEANGPDTAAASGETFNESAGSTRKLTGTQGESTEATETADVTSDVPCKKRKYVRAPNPQAVKFVPAEVTPAEVERREQYVFVRNEQPHALIDSEKLPKMEKTVTLAILNLVYAEHVRNTAKGSAADVSAALSDDAIMTLMDLGKSLLHDTGTLVVLCENVLTFSKWHGVLTGLQLGVEPNPLILVLCGTPSGRTTSAVLSGQMRNHTVFALVCHKNPQMHFVHTMANSQAPFFNVRGCTQYLDNPDIALANGNVVYCPRSCDSTDDSLGDAFKVLIRRYTKPVPHTASLVFDFFGEHSAVGEAAVSASRSYMAYALVPDEPTALVWPTTVQSAFHTAFKAGFFPILDPNAPAPTAAVPTIASPSNDTACVTTSTQHLLLNPLAHATPAVKLPATPKAVVTLDLAAAPAFGIESVSGI